MTARLTLDCLSVHRGPCPVVDDVSFSAGPGEFIGLIGPNGAGKTTLMRAALGLLAARGHASVARMSAAERARHVAWLPQAREIAWPVDVETLVALGRTPHLRAGGRLSHDDRAAVDHALARMGLDAFRTRRATELSGGEQARVLIARALAQETPLLMADEPGAGLDPANQIGLMRLFSDLAAEGRTVIASLHDLGMAVRHCSRLAVLDRGRLVADGAPADVLTPDLLARVFNITAYFRQTDQGPVYQPLEVLG